MCILVQEMVPMDRNQRFQPQNNAWPPQPPAAPQGVYPPRMPPAGVPGAPFYPRQPAPRYPAAPRMPQQGGPPYGTYPPPAGNVPPYGAFPPPAPYQDPYRAYSPPHKSSSRGCASALLIGFAVLALLLTIPVLLVKDAVSRSSGSYSTTSRDTAVSEDKTAGSETAGNEDEKAESDEKAGPEEDAAEPENKQGPGPDYSDPYLAEYWYSSDLSLYLAQQLVAGNTEIDMSGFSDSVLSKMLWDSWDEARFQNPMGLWLTSVRYDSAKKVMYVGYMDEQSVRERKQKEIRSVVSRFVSQYYRSGMGAAEVVYTISAFLCERAEYDYDALANMNETNNNPDVKYGDCWTPYGVLVDRKGVCESYADAFNMLARACGLESIFVNGYTYGDPALTHVWNRVNISGQWAVVDVTYCDTGLPYMSLCLSDLTAARYLTEKKEWVEDQRLNDFHCTTGKYEYFESHGLYYDRGSIVRALAADYDPDGYALLRTVPDLDEAGRQAVIDELNRTVTRRGGYYWWYDCGVFQIQAA